MNDSLDFLVSFWSKMLDALSRMPVVDDVSLIDVIIAAFIIVTIVLIVFGNRGGVK